VINGTRTTIGVSAGVVIFALGSEARNHGNDENDDNNIDDFHKGSWFGLLSIFILLFNGLHSRRIGKIECVDDRFNLGRKFILKCL
jgi:hypothetical protein